MDKPGPPPQPSAKAILSNPGPRGAVARRNRALKIYAVILLAGVLGLVGYCATRPGFDLSTPERALDSFKQAMDDQRWALAEKCLTPGCHAHYAEAIADRRLFDFYSPYGYTAEGYHLPRDWHVKSIEKRETTARAWVALQLPLVGSDQAGFWLELVRCPDGLWRVDGPREDFVTRYDQFLPERARGWAAAEERK